MHDINFIFLLIKMTNDLAAPNFLHMIIFAKLAAIALTAKPNQKDNIIFLDCLPLLPQIIGHIFYTVTDFPENPLRSRFADLGLQNFVHLQFGYFYSHSRPTLET